MTDVSSCVIVKCRSHGVQFMHYHTKCCERRTGFSVKQVFLAKKSLEIPMG